MTDLIIIGSGPAAWSAAMTARNRGLDVLVTGAQATTGWLYRSECVTNYPGMPNVSGRTLLDTFRQQAEDLGAAFRHGVVRQLTPLRSGGYMVLVDNDVLQCRAVILAVGTARPALLPGEEALLGRGVSWCGTCDGMFYRGKEIAVLNWWNGGLEDTRFLHGLAGRLDYYAMTDAALSDDFSAQQAKPAALEQAGSRIRLTMADGSAAEYDGVFLFRSAVAPDRMLPGLALDGSFIAVDRHMATNLPGVFAAGDCTGHPLQIAKAVGEGNIAAISAAEYLEKTRKA